MVINPPTLQIKKKTLIIFLFTKVKTIKMKQTFSREWYYWQNFNFPLAKNMDS
jgi:hypothetical protein